MTHRNDKVAKIVPLKARPCPACGKPEATEFGPFCSRRCADLDLGRWLNGEYRIPTDEKPSLDGEPPEED